MTTDKIIKTAQAHFTKNWKTYAILLGVLVLWANRDKILKALGLEKPKPSLDTGDEGSDAANDTDKGSIGLKQPDGTIEKKDFVYSQTVKNLTYDIYYWYEGWALTSSTQAERCNIAKKIVAMADNDIIEQNAHYMQAYNKSIYQAFMGVYNDPCSYWATESEYDAALKKLQNATKNVTTV